MTNKPELSYKDLIEALELIDYADKKNAYGDLLIVSEKAKEVKTKISNFCSWVSSQIAQQQNQKEVAQPQQPVSENFENKEELDLSEKSTKKSAKPKRK